jgi:hypothetical protein
MATVKRWSVRSARQGQARRKLIKWANPPRGSIDDGILIRPNHSGAIGCISSEGCFSYPYTTSMRSSLSW